MTTRTHARSQLSPVKQSDYSSIVVPFSWRRTFINTRSSVLNTILFVFVLPMRRLRRCWRQLTPWTVSKKARFCHTSVTLVNWAVNLFLFCYVFPSVLSECVTECVPLSRLQLYTVVLLPWTTKARYSTISMETENSCFQAATNVFGTDLMFVWL